MGLHMVHGGDGYELNDILLQILYSFIVAVLCCAARTCALIRECCCCVGKGSLLTNRWLFYQVLVLYRHTVII